MQCYGGCSRERERDYACVCVVTVVVVWSVRVGDGMCQQLDGYRWKQWVGVCSGCLRWMLVVGSLALTCIRSPLMKPNTPAKVNTRHSVYASSYIRVQYNHLWGTDSSFYTLNICSRVPEEPKVHKNHATMILYLQLRTMYSCSWITITIFLNIMTLFILCRRHTTKGQSPIQICCYSYYHGIPSIGIPAGSLLHLSMFHFWIWYYMC